MDIRIDELHTTIDTFDGDSLLSPDTLDRIVKAVLAAVERQQRSDEARRDDLDTRSIVDQQRAGRR